ncbi:maltokinase N-terminal cap-like domain-containing protein [Saccharomonospora halophila]|uniref:maltokinase N-terminal cap-like domain-containing protein n=1 Tax=Saccharomonospora halophila TaxID=129922 RepID=UPI0003782EED|nr:hypothetical protein [Saccharomonospora halophila]
MAKIHAGANLEPHFREFLPPWVARQSWYSGIGVPTLWPVGYFRFEDPDGVVGMETHLLSDGTTRCQVPMTYRDAPAETASLITTAEHSVLGTRWIYDGATDPTWTRQVLALVRTGGTSEPGGRVGVGDAQARGHPLDAESLRAPDEALRVELVRTPTPTGEGITDGVVGLVLGHWHPDGPHSPPVTGRLATVRTATDSPSGPS